MLASSTISFFRVSAAIFTIGISFLSFIIPLIIHQQNEHLFHLLHCFATGGLIAMGFISAIYESNEDLNTDNRFVWLLTSFSFICMLALENVLIQPRRYVQLSQRDGIDNENSGVDNKEDYANDVEMVDTDGSMSKLSNDDHTDGDDDIDNDEIISDDVLLKMKRATPLGLMIIILCVYGLIRGLVLGSTTHDDFNLLLRFLMQKAIVTLGLGCIIAQIEGVRSIFVMLTVIWYSFADAIGVVIGGLVFTKGLAAHNNIISFLRRFHLYLAGYGAAVAAGLYIYMAIQYMIAAYLDVNRLHVDGNRFIGVVLLILGYVITVTICLEYTL